MTAYSEYALDAFGVDADYLMKPVETDRLAGT